MLSAQSLKISCWPSNMKIGISTCHGFANCRIGFRWEFDMGFFVGDGFQGQWQRPWAYKKTKRSRSSESRLVSSTSMCLRTRRQVAHSLAFSSSNLKCFGGTSVTRIQMHCSSNEIVACSPETLPIRTGCRIRSCIQVLITSRFWALKSCESPLASLILSHRPACHLQGHLDWYISASNNLHKLLLFCLSFWSIIHMFIWSLCEMWWQVWWVHVIRYWWKAFRSSRS